MSLNGKCCIITGSAKGLGKMFAQLLLEAGAKVTLTDINEEIGIATKMEFKDQYGIDRVTFVPCDVTKDDQIENLFNSAEAFFQQSIDIFVNNAGVNPNVGWKMCMQVNLMAVMSASQMSVQRMHGRSGCKIVNIASIAGLIYGLTEDWMSYIVSKHAVVSLSLSLATLNANSGIDIVCLCPSWADTDLFRMNHVSKQEVEASAKKMGLLSIDEVGKAFMRLLSCDNGTVLAVLPNSPCLEFADFSNKKFMWSIMFGRFISKIMDVEVVKHKHFVIAFMVILFTLYVILAALFTKIYFCVWEM